MKRIKSFLQSIFCRASILRQERNEISKAVSTPDNEDLLRALRVRRAVEDGRLFLRPGLSLADVAAELNMEVDALEGFFARFIGGEFARYLDELRIAYVAVLFMGHEAHLYSIEKIGAECGFPDFLIFSGACRKLTGMTPEMMRDFIRSRKTLKGLFLNPPIHMTAMSSDALEEYSKLQNNK